MAKAPRHSKRWLTFLEACQQADGRLGVDDLDYAEKRLRRELAKDGIEFGRHWRARAIDPPDSDVDDLWRNSSWVVESRGSRAWKWVLERATTELVFARVYVYGIEVASMVVTVLDGTDAPASVGAPSVYDTELVESAVEAAFKEHGLSAMAKKVFVHVEEALADKTPGRTRLYAIISSIRKRLRRQLVDEQDR